MRRLLAVLVATFALVFASQASALAYVQPSGLWTETTFTAPPALTHNTECYKVTSTNYVCETTVDASYNWPGDNWYATTHQVQHTTQRFGGGPEWVCFNHGRVGFNASLTCFNPADY